MDTIKNYLRQNMTLPVILGAFGFMILICSLAGLGLYFLPPILPNDPPPTSVMDVIPQLTSTPYSATTTPTFVPTVTENIPPSPLPGMIGVGTIVQIFGTEGEGLNIRDEPGLGTEVVFLAFDSEVFEVGEGPLVVDQITWWFLVTPVNADRSGWAASNYLTLIPNP